MAENPVFTEDRVFEAILEYFKQANEVCGDPVAASLLVLARHSQAVGWNVGEVADALRNISDSIDTTNK